MFHIAMAPLTFTSALRIGSQNFIQRRFALEPYLAAIDHFQITDLVIVPPQVVAVLNAPKLLAR